MHLWGWRLAAGATNFSASIEILGEAEIERTHAFHFEEDRCRYAFTHANVRRILATYLEMRPEAIHFAANQYGKPEIAGQSSSLSFSLSHSQSIAVIAVTRSGPVGMDVEDIRPIEPEVAMAHFSVTELKALQQLSGAAWLDGFYRCWTRKEAILKAEGVGLHRALDSFDVALLAGQPAELLGTREPFQHAWKLHDVPPAPGTAGALATAHDIRIECFRFVA